MKNIAQNNAGLFAENIEKKNVLVAERSDLENGVSNFVQENVRTNKLAILHKPSKKTLAILQFINGFMHILADQKFVFIAKPRVLGCTGQI